MNAPIILGNDFADQYSLSIIREDGSTKLRLGTSNQAIPLDSSVDSAYLEVQAMQLEAARVCHRRNNKKRRRQRGPIRVYALESTSISPGSIKKIAIITSRPLMGHGIFIPSKQLPKRIHNSTIINSILPSSSSHIHITNDLGIPIQIQPQDIMGTIEDDNYYDQQ